MDLAFFFKGSLFPGEQLCYHLFRRNVIYCNSLRYYRNMINKEIPFPKMPLKFLKSDTRDLGSGFPSLNLRGFFFVVYFGVFLHSFLLTFPYFFVPIQLQFSDYTIVKLFKKIWKSIRNKMYTKFYDIMVNIPCYVAI